MRTLESAGLPTASHKRFVLITLSLIVFLATLAIRVRGISEHFWLLGDQIGDWQIALRPFTKLPLVGPSQHVGGYAIGPAYYWILWLIRVVFGPWFHNLPHAGGIGQATLTSAADVLLFLAIRKRTRSLSMGLTAVALLATAPFALSLAAVTWNPVVAATLSELAIALILLGWTDGSGVKTAVIAAIAWSAVHAHLGAIFVALSVFTALLVEPLRRRDFRTAGRVALIIVGTVALLQVPHAVHEWRSGPNGAGAVMTSITQVITGRTATRFLASAAGYSAAVNFVLAAPWTVPAAGWVLLACGLLVGWLYRRDPVVLAVTLLPQVLAVLGFAFWLDTLQSYYYLSIMVPAVLTVTLVLPGILASRMAQPIALLMLVAAILAVPIRMQSARFFRMPQYAALVRGSRTIVDTGQPMREVTTAFALPPTSEPTFIYRVLGGRLDPQSTWDATIGADGRVEFRRVSAQRTAERR